MVEHTFHKRKVAGPNPAADTFSMTKLLLTSQGINIQEEILAVLPRSPLQLKLLYIVTASTPKFNKEYIIEERKKLVKMGFTVEDIDIEGKNESELRQALKDKNVIYVAGGNTYYLLKQIQKSGFDVIAKEFISNGVIYIGVSAGSYVAGPTIEQSNWKHFRDDQFGLITLSAMDLVPFLIFAHFEEKWRELVEKNVTSTKYPVVALYDTQAVLVENGKWKIVGKGKREFYNGFKETLI